MPGRETFVAERRAISVQRYDTVHSPHYDAHWGAIGGTHADFIARILGLVRAGGEVLDVACGTGKYWPASTCPEWPDLGGRGLAARAAIRVACPRTIDLAEV